MFGFLNIGRSRHDRHNAEKTEVPSAVPHSTQQHTATRRELIRVVLRDTLRMHGIPTEWISCGLISQSRRPDDDAPLIQLVILKWNASLLQFAPALEQQLLLGLDRFDPVTDHSKYMVSWKFAPDCGCPFTTLPDPAFWSAVPAPAASPKFDLPSSELDSMDSRFAVTVPVELR